MAPFAEELLQPSVSAGPVPDQEDQKQLQLAGVKRWITAPGPKTQPKSATVQTTHLAVDSLQPTEPMFRGPRNPRTRSPNGLHKRSGETLRANHVICHGSNGNVMRQSIDELKTTCIEGAPVLTEEPVWCGLFTKNFRSLVVAVARTTSQHVATQRDTLARSVHNIETPLWLISSAEPATWRGLFFDTKD